MQPWRSQSSLSSTSATQQIMAWLPKLGINTDTFNNLMLQPYPNYMATSPSLSSLTQSTSQQLVPWIPQLEVVSGSIESESLESLHNATYQIKFLMLFAYKAMKTFGSLKLAGEIKNGDSFDDLLFDYKTHFDPNEWIHFEHAIIRNANMRIGLRDFSDNRNFKLDKFFIPFRKIRSAVSHFEDLIVFTNSKLEVFQDTEHNDVYKIIENDEPVYLERCPSTDKIFGLLGERFRIVGPNPIFHSYRKRSVRTIRNHFLNTVFPPPTIAETEKFMDRLMFVTNVTEFEIDLVLNEEIRDDLKVEHVEIELDHQKKFIKYIKDNKILELRDLFDYFQEWKQSLYTQHVMGLKFDYLLKFDSGDESFSKDSFEIQTFLNSMELEIEKRILLILTCTSETDIAAKKVLSTVKVSEKFCERDSYIMLNSGLSPKALELAVDAFEYEKKVNLFVIECDKNIKNYYINENKLFYIVLNNENKKLIIVAEKPKYEKDPLSPIKWIIEEPERRQTEVRDQYLNDLYSNLNDRIFQVLSEKLNGLRTQRSTERAPLN